jgi:hypothetical protein
MPTASSVRRQPSLRTILLAAPPIFVAHFLEEAPTFVSWFNAHVARGITEAAFWRVNYTALGITLAVLAVEWLGGTVVSAVLVVAWLSLLMFANAIFHLTGALADGAYVPGLLTALLLYLPYYAWVVAHVLRTRRLSAGVVAAAALAGAAPMLIHGYLIVFRGSRLF